MSDSYPVIVSPSSERRGFSLVEVVVAVGIFALAIVGVIGLLAPSIKAVSEIADTNVAARLAQNIQMELENYGFAPVVTATDPNGSLKKIQLVATKDGLRVVRSNGTTPIPADNDPVTGTPPGIAAADRYYLVEVTQFPAGNTLAYTAANNPGFVALSVRVLWPYKLPAAGGTSRDGSPSEQNSSIFNFALRP